mmetsp:Transcript_28748/g.63311  ORF Transcript_28748/g.63311 Transcript_28748/m.63311 type:complete len:190 (-) Transcript_28748:2363-2932(-)
MIHQIARECDLPPFQQLPNTYQIPAAHMHMCMDAPDPLLPSTNQAISAALLLLASQYQPGQTSGQSAAEAAPINGCMKTAAATIHLLGKGVCSIQVYKYSSQPSSKKEHLRPGQSSFVSQIAAAAVLQTPLPSPITSSIQLQQLLLPPCMAIVQSNAWIRNVSTQPRPMSNLHGRPLHPAGSMPWPRRP